MQQLLRCYACEIDNQWVDALPMVEFCFNNAVNESLRLSPFEANYGFKPLTPLDVVLPYTPFALSADAEKRVKLLKDTHAYASELLRLAKDRMAHSDREPVEFVPGDFVYLSTKGLRIQQQSNKKLRDRQLGPFRVSHKIGNRAYAIDLPRTFRLHNVFHVDVLRKASSPSPLQKGPLNVGPEAEDAEGEEYLVEKISNVKIAPFGRKRGLWLQFLVHYFGYPEPEWSLLSDVDDLEVLDEFYASTTWRAFSDSPEYRDWAQAYPSRKPKR
jgi:hypothetical protein